MGAVEAGGDEERPLPVLFHQRDGFPRDLAIGMLVVGRGRRVVGERAADPARRRVIGQSRLLVLVDAARIDHAIPGRRIVESVGADLAGIAVVVNLADARDRVAVLPEELRERHDVRMDRPEVRLQVVDANGIGAEAGQHRCTARVAQRELHVGAIEPDSARGEPVEVRRLDQRMALGAEIEVEIVGHDEQDVRRPRRLPLAGGVASPCHRERARDQRHPWKLASHARILARRRQRAQGA